MRLILLFIMLAAGACAGQTPLIIPTGNPVSDIIVNTVAREALEDFSRRAYYGLTHYEGPAIMAMLCQNRVETGRSGMVYHGYWDE